MNRRTLLLGTLVAAAGAVLPKVQPLVHETWPCRSIKAVGPGCYVLTCDDRELLVVFRRMKAEVDAYKTKLLALKDGSKQRG